MLGLSPAAQALQPSSQPKPPKPPKLSATARAVAAKKAALGDAPVGKHKWLGGTVTPEGDIVGIPSHAPSVIKVTPGDDPGIEFLGEGRLGPQRGGWNVKFKWLRGMTVGDACYGIPAWADSVMKLSLDTWEVTTFGEEELRPAALAADAARVAAKRERTLRRKKEQMRQQEAQSSGGDGGGGGGSGGGDDEEEAKQVGGEREGRAEGEEDEDDEDDEDTDVMGWRWMWHGAALADDGKTIYAIPACADRVLRVDTATGDVRRVGPVMRGMQKWYGGIKGAPGSDGAIYGMPYGAGDLLKIKPAADPEDVTVEHVPVAPRDLRGCEVAPLPDGERWRWHGGVRCAGNGAIYAFPAHSAHVLKVDTLAGGATSQLGISPDAPAAVKASMQGRYKWLGGCVGADGAVYGVPSDSSCILRVDPATDAVTTFGHGAVPGEKNKWQGGVLAADGCVYCIPSDACSVLRIDTNPGVFDGAEGAPLRGDEPAAYAAVSLIGDLPATKDKWQGGFLGTDGAIYGIPECADRVLKVVPATGEVLQLRYPGE